MTVNLTEKFCGTSLTNLVILINFGVFTIGYTQNRLFHETQLTLKAVDKALTYFRNNPKTLFDDVKLGVFLARSNLQWISDRFQSRFGNDHFMNKVLGEMMRMCDHVLEMNKTQNSLLLNEKFWKRGAKDIIYGALQVSNDNLSLSKINSCQEIDDYMMKGTPDDSDYCINELFKFDCKVSNYCWLSETNDHFHSGYKTSHRLMYLQAADKLQCSKKNKRKYFDIGKRRKNLCQQMLSEARALVEAPYFPAVRDLFLEQIALCGFEGFGEFGPKNWRKKVRRWQNKKGCFEQSLFHVDCSSNDSSKFVKRTDSIVDDCHTHLTSVALAAMAFHLRIILNSAFFSVTKN